MLGPGAASTNTNRDAHDAGADDEQATDRDQHEPGDVEAEEPGGVLALAQRANRLVAAIRAVVDAVTDQVRVDAESGQCATEVFACVFWGKKEKEN